MRSSIPAALSCFLFAGSAFANPMWTSRLSVTSAGPHVLLAQMCDPVSSACSAQFSKLYGTSHSEWQSGADTSADTGSGSRTLKTRHMCDCHVPTGVPLSYALDYSTYSVTVPADPPTTGTCADECALADARDAAVPIDTDPASDGSVDNSPVAVGTGGATGTGGSTTPAGTGGGPGAGGATIPAGTGGTPGSGGTSVAQGSGGAPSGSGGRTGESASKGGGSCAIVPDARPGALTLLCLVAALALGRRRRA